MAAAGAVSGKTGWRATAWGEYLSEFLGTFVLIMFGVGSVAMAVAALNQSGRGTKIFDASGDWLFDRLGLGARRRPRRLRRGRHLRGPDQPGDHPGARAPAEVPVEQGPGLTGWRSSWARSR